MPSLKYKTTQSIPGEIHGEIHESLKQLRRCEKIVLSHQVGRGYWKSFTAVLFLCPAATIESFYRIDELRRFVTHIFSNDPQL
jgi:hypothetical protein